jgi:hypothetical protein
VIALAKELVRYRSVMADSGRWEGFAFRGDDIVISTPPKCGTTWMQMLVAMLVFGTPDLPKRLTELSPWIDIQTEKVEDVRATLEAQEHRRFIKTHTPFDGIPFDERVTYICVGRDLRDVAISWDHHFANMNLPVIITARAEAVGLDDLAELMPDGPPARSEDPVERFWEWVDGDGPLEGAFATLKSSIHHLSTFWENRDRPNVHLFHYSDMQADLEGEMRRLADALGISVDDVRLHELAGAATFEQMSGRATQLAPQVKVDGFWNNANNFFHAGTSGQWEAILTTPEDCARYDARVRELAAPDLAAWLTRPSLSR